MGEGGFTLVELLAVIAIFGLAAAAVVLAFPEPEGSLVAEAERFAARAKAARDGAVIESRAAAVEIGPGGYSFSRRQGGEWRVVDQHSWTEGTAAEASAARTVFDSTGLADPLRLSLRRRDIQVAVEIGHDGSVAVRR